MCSTTLSLMAALYDALYAGRHRDRGRAGARGPSFGPCSGRAMSAGPRAVAGEALGSHPPISVT